MLENLFRASRSYVGHSIPTHEFKLEFSSGNAGIWAKSSLICPCDIEIWQMTLTNNKAPVLCHKIYTSFRSHLLIEIAVIVLKRFGLKSSDFNTRVT